MTAARVIDVHGHVGVTTSRRPGLPPPWMWGDAHDVRALCNTAGVADVFVSSLWSCRAWSRESEREAREAAETEEGTRFWAVLDPRISDSWDALLEAMAHPRCVGVKLHPVWQQWDLRDHLDRIMEVVSSHHSVVLTHSEVADPLVSPLICADAANRYPDATLIMAHLGYGAMPRSGLTRDQMIAIRLSRHGNLFVDTSSQHMIFEGFLELAVAEFGADQILFGTDVPLHSSAAIVARVAQSRIPSEAKEKILSGNAIRIWGSL